MLRETLLALVGILTISVAVEALVPTGSMAPFVRYFVGTLFLLVVLHLFTSCFSAGEMLSLPEVDAQSAELQFQERVIHLQEEKVKNDLLTVFSDSVSSCTVICGDDCTVERVELVAKAFVSRSEISERYGVLEQNIIIRGVGER